MPSAPPRHRPPGLRYVPKREPFARRITPRKVSWSRWDRLRQAVFMRDGFRCQVCLALVAHPECDHVLPVSQGGTDDMGNLQTICPTCHRAKSQRESHRPGAATVQRGAGR